MQIIIERLAGSCIKKLRFSSWPGSALNDHVTGLIIALFFSCTVLLLHLPEWYPIELVSRTLGSYLR